MLPRQIPTINGRPVRGDDCAHHWHQMSEQVTQDGVYHTCSRCCHCNSVQLLVWHPKTVAEATPKHGPYVPLAPGEERPRRPRRRRRPVVVA